MTRRKRKITPLLTAPLQGHALDQSEAVASAVERGRLLSQTGPLAQLQKADKEHYLKQLARVVKQGKGVVFEGETVTRLHGVGERYGLELKAYLSPKRNDPIGDIYVEWKSEEIAIQLKTGSEGYLRKAATTISARDDGTWLLTQSDVSDGLRERGARTSLEFDDIEIPSPTMEEMEATASRDLERLSRGQATFDHFEIAKNSLYFGLIDGLAGLIIDAVQQKWEDPKQAVDWRRAGGVFFRRAALGTAAGILAGSGTGYALSLDAATVTTTSCLRASRAVGLVLPRAMATYQDYQVLQEGGIEKGEFRRRCARQAGAVAVEWSAFQLASRYAAGLGPIGQFVVLLGGSLLAENVGGGIGEFVLSLFTMPRSRALVEKVVEGGFREVREEIRVEEERRKNLATQRLCEEPKCGRDHHARGLCTRHYQRWYRKNRRYMALVEGRLVTEEEALRAKNSAAVSSVRNRPSG